MHRDFADWYRSTTIDLNHDLLERRWAGVETILKTFDRTDLLALTRFVYDLDPCDKKTIDKMRAAFKEADNAFQMRDNDEELRMLAASALMQQLTTHNDSKSDTVALGIFCADAHGFGPRPALSDLLGAAATYLTREAVEVRATAAVTDPTWTVGKTHELIESAKTLIGQGQAPSAIQPISESITVLEEGLGTLVKSVEKSVRSLGKAQQTLQEETNILWWVFGGYSRDLGEPMQALGVHAVCIVAAKELADLTIFMPGPTAARAFLDRLMRHDDGDFPTATIKDVVNASPRTWRESWGERYTSLSRDGLFPITMAVVRSLETESLDDWLAAYEKASPIATTQALPLLDIADQLYHELLLARTMGLNGQ